MKYVSVRLTSVDAAMLEWLKKAKKSKAHDHLVKELIESEYNSLTKK